MSTVHCHPKTWPLDLSLVGEQLIAFLFAKTLCYLADDQAIRLHVMGAVRYMETA